MSSLYLLLLLPPLLILRLRLTVTIGYGYIITRPSLITITAAITTITHTVITRGVSGVPHTNPTPPAARRPGASRASRRHKAPAKGARSTPRTHTTDTGLAAAVSSASVRRPQQPRTPQKRAWYMLQKSPVPGGEREEGEIDAPDPPLQTTAVPTPRSRS